MDSSTSSGTQAQQSGCCAHTSALGKEHGMALAARHHTLLVHREAASRWVWGTKGSGTMARWAHTCDADLPFSRAGDGGQPAKVQAQAHHGVAAALIYQQQGVVEPGGWGQHQQEGEGVREHGLQGRCGG